MNSASGTVAAAPAGFAEGRVLNIDKPEGWTSFDVVKKIRNQIRPVKVGHAGTLDPFATGVLLLCTGKATKRVNELMALTKEYVATLELGKRTDSFDVTGEVVEQKSYLNITRAELETACGQFVGEISQLPPMFSAVKVKGQRLYKLARAGKTVEREPRTVHIYELEIRNFDPPYVDLRVVCSKGTYIRALAEDIGAVLNCGAYLKKLVRTRIGSYRLEDAVTVPGMMQKIKESAVT